MSPAGQGFFEAVENLLNLFRLRYRLEIQSDLRGDEKLESGKQLVLYRVLQEALNNVAKHAGTKPVRVGLLIQDGWGELQVRDQGVGFDPQECQTAVCLGIKGMRERVAQLNGQFTLQSAPGQGTTVRARV